MTRERRTLPALAIALGAATTFAMVTQSCAYMPSGDCTDLAICPPPDSSVADALNADRVTEHAGRELHDSSASEDVASESATAPGADSPSEVVGSEEMGSQEDRTVDAASGDVGDAHASVEAAHDAMVDASPAADAREDVGPLADSSLDVAGEGAADAVACGTSGQLCCTSGAVCGAAGCCDPTTSTCVDNGVACPTPGSVCAGGVCQACGAAGLSCCASSTCNGGGCCDMGSCVAQGSLCANTQVCFGGSCGGCGAQNEACCASGICQNGLACIGNACIVNGADAGSAGLQWCPWLDYLFALPGSSNPDAGADAGICATETPADGTCPNRIGTNTTPSVAGWDAPFSAGQPTGIPNDFFVLLYGNGSTSGPDCRIALMASYPILTIAQMSDYQNQVVAWTLALFGCPEPSVTIGPPAFGLVPAPEATHQFTTADLQLLEDMYVAAINQALSDNSAVNGGPSALTPQQESQVRAQMSPQEMALSPISMSAYSFSTCSADGGSD